MADPIEMRFPAHASELARMRRHVREQLNRANVEESIVADVVRAIDEACQNVIRHCYGGAEGDIVLKLTRRGDTLEVELTDFGPRVDPAALAGRDLDDVRPGGLGIHLIRECMDDVAYEAPPEGAGNLLRMLKKIR